jgi:hypothetical protein
MADPGENNGQIWKESAREGQEGDGGTQERNLEKRKVQEEGHEPETGDRYRAFRGSSRGREGAQKESLFQEKDVLWKEGLFEEKIRSEEDLIQLVTMPERLRDSSGNEENCTRPDRRKILHVDRGRRDARPDTGGSPSLMHSRNAECQPSGPMSAAKTKV